MTREAWDLCNDAAVMMRGIITAFYEWAGDNWLLDFEKIKREDETKTEDYCKGWNDAIASLDQCAKCWLEELP